MRFHVPIELPSLANARMNWRVVGRIKKAQRLATRLSMVGKDVPLPPVVVKITRIGPRRLDGDNLQAACKYLRDEIARVVGVDDGSPLYTWVYGQRTGDYGVDVEITTRDEDQRNDIETQR